MKKERKREMVWVVFSNFGKVKVFSDKEKSGAYAAIHGCYRIIVMPKEFFKEEVIE